MSKNKRIFFDYASATPLNPRVFKVMKPWLSFNFENSAALYRGGLKAKKALENARKKVARAFSSRPDEIVFTSGGTEGNNLAILGVFEAARRNGVKRPHIITSVIEHPSIIEVAREAARRGGEVTHLKVDELGHFSLEDLKKSIKKNTCLVTFAYANSEIGTIIPIREISAILKKCQSKNRFHYPYFHIDLGQTPLFLPIRPHDLHADLVTLDGAKIYGPKGSGALFVGKNISIHPLIRGGMQEHGLRAGTQNIPAIVGLGEALTIALKDRGKEVQRLGRLRNYFISHILKTFPRSRLNADPKRRLLNNANFCFPEIDGEYAVIKLDVHGVACSSASSCRTLTNESYSYVIEALGRKNCAESSLRFSFGKDTTKKEIDRALKIIQKVLVEDSKVRP